MHNAFAPAAYWTLKYSFDVVKWRATKHYNALIRITTRNETIVCYTNSLCASYWNGILKMWHTTLATSLGSSTCLIKVANTQKKMRSQNISFVDIKRQTHSCQFIWLGEQRTQKKTDGVCVRKHVSVEFHQIKWMFCVQIKRLRWQMNWVARSRSIHSV